MWSKLLAAVLMLSAATAAAAAAATTITFPLEMRVVDSNTSKLIEFRDGESVTHLCYESDGASGRSFTRETVPYVTLPFGRMNVSMPLGTLTEIFLITSTRLDKLQQRKRFPFTATTATAAAVGARNKSTSGLRSRSV